MKIHYQFDYYEDKDLREAFEKGPDAIAAIEEIRGYLRTLGKYDERVMISIDEVTEKFFEILTIHGLEEF